MLQILPKLFLIFLVSFLLKMNKSDEKTENSIIYLINCLFKICHIFSVLTPFKIARFLFVFAYFQKNFLLTTQIQTFIYIFVYINKYVNTIHMFVFFLFPRNENTHIKPYIQLHIPLCKLVSSVIFLQWFVLIKKEKNL